MRFALPYEILEGGTLANLTLPHHMAEVLKRAEINCVIDVGGNVGAYGSFLRMIGYRGRIVSFEPVSDTFAELEARAQGDEAWSAHRLAIGSTDGVASVNVARNPLFSSLRAPSDEGIALFPDDERIERREEVELRRLDTVFGDCVAGIEEPRVYLKSHAQGWDLEVLRGASGCLNSVLAVQTYVAPRRIYEQMPGYLESFAFLEDLGYRLTGFFPVNRDEELRVIEFDCVCVRER